MAGWGALGSDLTGLKCSEVFCPLKFAARALRLLWETYEVSDRGFEQRLAFDAEGKLFDDGVGQNLGGDALDLCFRGFGVDSVFKGEEEILSLADVADAFVLHATECIGDGLALSIEDRSFESYIDMSLHRV